MWLLPRGMQLGSHPVGAAALPCERLRPWPQISSWTGLVTFLYWPVVGFTPQTSYSAFPPSAWENSQLSSLSPRDTSSSSKAGDTPNGKQNCSQGGGNRGGGGKDRWPPHPFPWSALEAGQEGGAGVELGSPHTPPHLQSRGTLNLCSSSSPDSEPTGSSQEKWESGRCHPQGLAKFPSSLTGTCLTAPPLRAWHPWLSASSAPSVWDGRRVLGAWPSAASLNLSQPRREGRVRDRKRAAHEPGKRQRPESLGILPSAPPRSPLGHDLASPARGLFGHRGCCQYSGQKPDAGPHKSQCGTPQVLGGDAHLGDQKIASLLSQVTAKGSSFQGPGERGPLRLQRESERKGQP